MNMLTVGLLVAVFLFSASLVELTYLCWEESKFAEKRRVKKRLLYISAGGKHGKEKLSIYRKRAMDGAGVLERLVFRLPRIPSLDRMLLNAEMPINASTFIMGTLAVAVISGILAAKLLPHPGMGVLLGLIVLALPFGWLRVKEKATFARFEEQLPEAMDLLARAVRSGHALSAGMKMVAEEMQDPIGSEFAATVDEIDLGLSMKEALENLNERVTSQDLRFFSIAVLIQKETGGNIAEIFDNIGRLIRERIQFRRQVKALTAEGRLSGGILVMLPIVMFIYIYFANYEYLSLLWTEQVGHYLILAALILQIVGLFVIRKIVNIEI